MMRRIWMCLATLAAMLAPLPAAAQNQSSGADAAPYLAGNWKMLFEGKGECGFPAPGNQMGFEFERSGGRALFYEGLDLWTAFVGIEARITGDTIDVTAVDLDGKRKPLFQLKRIGPDEMQFVTAPGSEPGRTLVRCPAGPPFPIAADVTTADLSALTPLVSGLPILGQLLPGEDPGRICRGEQRPADADDPSYEHRRISIGFELFGPAHRWIFVNGAGELRDFSVVRAIRRDGPGKLILSITHRPTGKDRELEVRILPDRIEIPALNMAFFACTPAQMMALQKRQEEQ